MQAEARLYGRSAADPAARRQLAAERAAATVLVNELSRSLQQHSCGPD